MAPMLTAISALMQSSGVTFGTSGARGLVTAMTDRVCYAYTVAFLQHLEQHGRCQPGAQVAIAGDLRSSTDRIMRAVACAVSDRGYMPVSCGHIPSPAVASFGLRHRIAAIMVTGSHIPDDRNGIKYNAPEGEILKSDEESIRNQSVLLPERFDAQGMLRDGTLPATQRQAARDYVHRYVDVFPREMLAGKRLGLYAHSAVGRDIIHEILEALGAHVTRLADSDVFIPVDTEAIRPEDIALAASWAKEYGFDALLSTDGDSDRPLIADEHGRWLRGDVAGILCAKQLGADVVVTPVSSNSAVEECKAFSQVIRTRIGSPFVIEAMLRACQGSAKRVVGYEANGGFLTSSPISAPRGLLPALPTRDAVIVHLSLLWASASSNRSLSAIVKDLPARFTWSDRLQNVPTQLSQGRLEELRRDGLPAIAREFEVFGPLSTVDWTDGMRMTFASGAVVHIRPSGNAPELRCYTEGASEDQARQWNAVALEIVGQWK
jgi:phosphomannomutase